MSGTHLIEPSILSAIADLKLVAKTVVTGFQSGPHAGPRTGSGMEFSQYRGYQPGDDLRQLDWRMYARSDKFFIRETQSESDLTLLLLLDTSASMNLVDQLTGLSKFRYAKMLAACLLFLAANQGDAFCLVEMGPSKTGFLPPAHGPVHLDRALAVLQACEAKGRWTTQAWARGRSSFSGYRRLLTVVISDFYQQEQEIEALLTSFAGRGHECLAFHLDAASERHCLFQQAVTLEDLETGDRMEFDPQRDGPGYIQAYRCFADAWKRRLQERGIVYRNIGLDQPLDDALGTFLRQRARRVR